MFSKNYSGMEVKPKWIIFAVGLILVLNVAISIVVHAMFTARELDSVIRGMGYCRKRRLTCFR